MSYRSALLFLMLVMCARIGVIFYDGAANSSLNDEYVDMEKELAVSAQIERPAKDDEDDIYDEFGFLEDEQKKVTSYSYEQDTSLQENIESEPTPAPNTPPEYTPQEYVSPVQHEEKPQEYYVNIPERYEIPGVPFFSQAPYGNWNEPYQNACEEASMLLAYYYVKGMNPTKKQYNQDLLNLMDWEQTNLGHHKDTTIQEFLLLAKKYLYVENSYILNNPTVDAMKKVISEGKIIVAPFRGKQLENPHYALGGPDYHVMVINGYTADTFITQDVGTSKGKNRAYSIDTIMKSLSNGNKKELYVTDEKKVIVMYK